MSLRQFTYAVVNDQPTVSGEERGRARPDLKPFPGRNRTGGGKLSSEPPKEQPRNSPYGREANLVEQCLRTLWRAEDIL